MAWCIQCPDEQCAQQTWAENIVDLIQSHTDGDGWFVCEHCKSKGSIKKSFKLQEPGEKWEPYLRAAITLGKEGAVYQPFVFLVSYEPSGAVGDVWFSYYKDLRSQGGRLKLGYGPGGPPVLTSESLAHLLRKLIDLGTLQKDHVLSILDTKA